ncbi:MAG TPA: aspartyl/asparaginyl beta-hydroxylase domain-containing protein [Allosphingosinicella sp.]
MELSNQEAERLVREAVDAFQQGRPGEARARLDRVAATGRANAQIWLLLATVCRALRDVSGEEAALDRVLEMEPRAIRALIMKADCRAAAADYRIAASLYKKARNIAASERLPPGQTLPADLVAELRRAEAAAAGLDARYSVHIESSLAAQGLPPENRSYRFQQSIDIMSDRGRIFLQEPTGYYFPELPHVQFYDREDFDWVPSIEAATDVIREELLAVMATGIGDFCPYIRPEPNQPRHHPLFNKTEWSALFFVENGRLSEETIARCPETWKAVQAAPLPWIAGWEPTVMFSLLRAKTAIPPHSGTHNTRLICHLPLIVPPDCGFRVGNQIRQWEEGKLLLFDDTIEHEAWNNSSEDRVVLIFGIWRPELSDRERHEVSALFSVPSDEEETPS